LVDLVDDLQQLTKADAAKAHLRREDLSLPDLVDEMVELYRQQFETRGIAVITRIDEGATRVVGDRDKLRQAMRNLIENAWRYTTEGGRVEIGVERRPDGITLTIANTGAGIAEADLPYIFERFYRADQSRSRESGGAGIGLAIVKELVEAHGGHVGAASEAGKTRVWFSLPAPAT
jgi:signal transduction histidine kinase